mmetsp:Transcript_39874/g.51389  ORF Transcript_39874/g.51389 Transcript_39874/m.51389 type:complete len:346 (+) Transcript_39874:82-1119(+)
MDSSPDVKNWRISKMITKSMTFKNKTEDFAEENGEAKSPTDDILLNNHNKTKIMSPEVRNIVDEATSKKQKADEELKSLDKAQFHSPLNANDYSDFASPLSSINNNTPTTSASPSSFITPTSKTSNKIHQGSSFFEAFDNSDSETDEPNSQQKKTKSILDDKHQLSDQTSDISDLEQITPKSDKSSSTPKSLSDIRKGASFFDSDNESATSDTTIETLNNDNSNIIHKSVFQSPSTITDNDDEDLNDSSYDESDQVKSHGEERQKNAQLHLSSASIEYDPDNDEDDDGVHNNEEEHIYDHDLVKGTPPQNNLINLKNVHDDDEDEDDEDVCCSHLLAFVSFKNDF